MNIEVDYTIGDKRGYVPYAQVKKLQERVRELDQRDQPATTLTLAQASRAEITFCGAVIHARTIGENHCELPVGHEADHCQGDFHWWNDSQPAAQDADVVAEMLDAYWKQRNWENGTQHNPSRIEQMTAALAVARRGMVPAGESHWILRLAKFRQALDEAGLHGHYNLFQQYFGEDVVMPVGKCFTLAEIKDAVAVTAFEWVPCSIEKADDLASEVLARLSPPKPKSAQERVTLKLYDKIADKWRVIVDGDERNSLIFVRKVAETYRTGLVAELERKEL
jgi:hypothetical protein